MMKNLTRKKRKEILSYLKLEVDHITDLILLLLNEAVVTSKTLDFKKEGNKTSRSFNGCRKSFKSDN